MNGARNGAMNRAMNEAMNRARKEIGPLTHVGGSPWESNTSCICIGIKKPGVVNPRSKEIFQANNRQEATDPSCDSRLLSSIPPRDGSGFPAKPKYPKTMILL